MSESSAALSKEKPSTDYTDYAEYFLIAMIALLNEMPRTTAKEQYGPFAGLRFSICVISVICGWLILFAVAEPEDYRTFNSCTAFIA